MARPITISVIGDTERLDNSIEESGSKLNAFAQKLGGWGMIAGAGLGAGLTAGIMEGLDQEKGTDLLAAQLGASPEQSAALGKAAGKVYAAGYGESVADANEALKRLWQQGLVPAGATADEMARLSKTAMDVTDILGGDMMLTGNAVAQMLKTGMAANAQEAFDILVVGAQNGTNKSEDLLETFNEYSTQFRRVGLDGKTAMGLISQAIQGGARDSDQVADALGQFGERALAGGTAVDDAYKSIGLNSADIAQKIGAGGKSAEEALKLTLDALRGTTDEQTKLNAAAALFGDPANVMGAALFAMDPATAAASNGLANVEGAAARAGDTLHDNASTRLTAFGRNLKQHAVEMIIDHVVPAVNAMSEKLSHAGEIVRDVGKWVDENKTPLLVTAGVIGTIVTPALVAWGVSATVAGAANIAAWVTSTATAGTSSATQVLAHWAVIGGWVKSGAAALATGATVVGQWLLMGAQALWNAARVAGAQALVVAGYVAAGAAALAAGAVVVGQWILMGAQAMLGAARMAAAWLIAMGPIILVIAAIAGLVYFVVKYWDEICAKSEAAWTWVWDKVKWCLDALWNLFLNFTGVGLIVKHWDDLMRLSGEAFDWVVNKGEQSLKDLLGFFTNLPGNIVEQGKAIGNAAKEMAMDIARSIAHGLSQPGEFAESIGAAIQRAGKDALNTVIDLLNDGIPNSFGWGPLSIDIPDNPIPKIRAMGGPASGWTRVGERGPEVVNLPRGSTVVPNHAIGGAASVTVNVTSTADPYAIGREVAWALRVGR